MKNVAYSQEKLKYLILKLSYAQETKYFYYAYLHHNSLLSLI